MASPARVRVRVNRWLMRAGFPQDWFLVPLAAIIGALGGVVAAAFHYLVEASGAFFFERVGRVQFRASEWVLLVALPAIGGLAVGLIQRYIAHSPPGHGIPEVIESLARKSGYLPGKSGLLKAITSSLTIGSGGSAGVEGPIIQIGSVVGSVVGRYLRVGREHMHTLVGCGAAAGLAGIFNAPIAGFMFVLEVMLRDFSLKTFMPIVIAAVLGTAVGQALLGRDSALFMIPQFDGGYHFMLVELAPYALLGVACGTIGVTFTLTLSASERLWHGLRWPAWWVRPALGGALLGGLGIAFVALFTHPFEGYEPPPFYGNGYPVIQELFNPHFYHTQTAAHLTLLLLTLTAVKIVGTALTLGSGGSGGIFAPSLFMGATLGGALGVGFVATGLLGPDASPAPYALAGMAGMIAATAHCPLTAFLLVFEITRDYRLILPVMIVAILATLVSQRVQRDSIYVAILREQGIRMGTLADMTLLRRLSVSIVPLTPAVLVEPEDPAQKLIDLASEYAATDFAVIDGQDRYVGMVVGEDVRTTLLQREALPLLIVGELMRRDLPTVTREETLELTLEKFARHDVASLPVVDTEGRVKGLVTRSRLMRAYQQALSG